MSKAKGSNNSCNNQKSVPNNEAQKEEKDSNPISYLKSFMNSSTLKKDKNERSRFLGDGVSYKAKLIGILEVSEARGDRMCQEALADLKMAIRAAGEHKQRININIAIDGLRLRDEKTGDCLYHHPVHKISFIAQDMSDSRAFGYIFGSPDTGHRFFGIKTDKAASQVVISMRDLFQVVFELKKKEIEMAKQHIEQHQIKFTSNLLPESQVVKASAEPMKMLPIAEDKNKEGTCGAEGGEKQEQIMDLLDLELELNNIQQGINQMERITPSDPFGPQALSRVQADPFGDSFNPLTTKAKLPPPPDTSKRSRVTEKHWFDQETEALFEETDLPTSLSSLHANAQPIFSPPGVAMPLSTQCVVDENTVKNSDSSPTREQFDVFTELDPLGTGRSKPYVDKKDFFQELKNPPKKVLKDLVSEIPTDSKSMFQTNFGNDASVLLNSKGSDQSVVSKPVHSTQVFPDPFQDDPFDKDPFSEVDFSQNVCFTPTSNNDPFEKFADFASFNTTNEDESISDVNIQQMSSVDVTDETNNVPLRVSLPPEKLNNENVFVTPQQLRKHKLQKHNTVTGIIKLPSPKLKGRSKFISHASVDDNFVDHGSPIMEGVTLRNRNLTQSLSSGSTCSDLVAPEPPPRSSMNAMAPPLPPKRLAAASVKPPPRPPQSDYDYIENYQTTNISDINSPPLPAPVRKPKNGQKPRTETEYYLQPFPLLPPPKKKNPPSPKSSSITNETNVSPKSASCANKSLDITLSQLTKSGFSDLAATLNMSPTSLSKMTLQDLTKCLAKLANDKEDGMNSKLNGENKNDKGSILNSEQYLALRESIEDDTPTFPVEFDAHFDNKFQTKNLPEESLFDKYAVFRELLEQEKKQNDITTEENVNIIDENSKETDFETLKEEESLPPDERPNNQPVEDRYAALRDICLDEVLQEDEGDGSEKDDSIVEPSRMEEDTDLLSQSRPHSESTDSPTLTMKEHQSIMETTIMEEDVSALDVDEEEPPEESVDDTIQETSPPDAKYEEGLTEPAQTGPHNEKPLFSPHEENYVPVENKLGVPTPVGSVVSWAKFDNGNGLVLDKGSSIHSEGRVSPWSTESKDNDTSPACREQRKHRKTKRHKQNLWQEDEESEEGWDGRMESSCWSPSWRENGWSDGDSLYDDTPPYMERDYHSPRRGRRRRVSPWNSRDHSPWEEDDRDLSEDQWEGSRWQEEPRQRPKLRPVWDEERKRHYEDPRKPRKPIMWTNEMDRKSSRESLTWEDDDRYQKRNYTDRRRRKWDDESHSRSRGWRERDWIEPGMKPSCRYYRERSHEPSWDDLYSEHGDDEVGHWTQRPRSCERGRRQYSSHHSNDGDYAERRFIHSLSREEYCAEMDYRRKSHTLQSQKSRRKHSQNSPFEDDFMSHFSFSKDMKSPGGGSDVFDSDNKQAPPQGDNLKKCSFTEGAKKKEYTSPTSHNVTAYSRDSLPSSKGFRSYQQSPFEDDFTPPTPRRSSGRSASSDISEPKGNDDIYFESKDSSKPLKIESTRRPKSANQIDNYNINKNVKYSSVANLEAESDSNGSKSASQVEPENTEVDTPSSTSEKKPVSADFKQGPSLRRSDSNTSLRKSESVNIFARNRDPFDDDFFCDDSPVQQNKEKKVKGHESNKWTDAFNAFSFDEESK